jgi:hypothetical protein
MADQSVDFLKLSSVVSHHAQALAELHRVVESMVEGRRNGTMMDVSVSKLRKLSHCLRTNAELADSISVVLDQQVQVSA